MSPRMLFVHVVLGVSVLARMGSAETRVPSATGAARPALFAGSGSTLQVRRYYKEPPPPAPAPARRAPEPQSWFIMRGGFFDGDNTSKEDWTIGLKTVGHVAPSFRVGGTVDLQRRTNSERTVYTEYVDASGNRVQSAVTTAESESNLIPLMAVAEFVMPVPGIQPYVGIGGGWEFLHVKAFDYTSAIAYEANYDGPGWQVYAGADFMIAPRMRLNAEVFHNEATVERGVFDPYAGFAYEERIDADGTGGRFGLSFAF